MALPTGCPAWSNRARGARGLRMVLEPTTAESDDDPDLTDKTMFVRRAGETCTEQLEGAVAALVDAMCILDPTLRAEACDEAIVRLTRVRLYIEGLQKVGETYRPETS